MQKCLQTQGTYIVFNKYRVCAEYHQIDGAYQIENSEIQGASKIYAFFLLIWTFYKARAYLNLKVTFLDMFQLQTHI